MASTEQTTSRKGSCLCGTLSWTVAGEPARVNLCHCSNCAKVTGSAFGFFGAYPKKNFHLTEPTPSPLKTYSDKTTTSGKPLERSFCSDCGSTMFTQTQLAPEMIIVAMGTANEKMDIPVASEFWACRRVQCIPMIEGVTSFEGNPTG